MNMFIRNVNAIIRNTGFRPLSMNFSGTFDIAIVTASPMKAIPNPIKSSTTNRATI